MEWKNWNPREGKIANKDLVTEFSESLAAHDTSSSKFLKIVKIREYQFSHIVLYTACTNSILLFIILDHVLQ